VRAYYLGPEYRYALGTFSWKPLRVVYPLTSGGVLVAETVDELTVRVLGLPPGFWAGILGFVVAALALYAVVRETSPLARLARSVERFGEAIEPAPVPERGAREVRALIVAFNHMQSRIADLVRGRTFMLAAISHDLRTYLTRLRLRVEMVADADVRERATRDVEDMNALLEDALAFARTSFNGAAGESVDVVGVVRLERARGDGRRRTRDIAAARLDRGGRARRACARRRQPDRQRAQIRSRGRRASGGGRERGRDHGGRPRSRRPSR
jgi:signal transduction histidine kinase